VSRAVKHSQYECAALERLEDNKIVSMCADPDGITQVGTRNIAKGTIGDRQAVPAYFSDERDGALRIVERDEVADLL
jgi:hypothetical protein